jgi:hypothetical protein
LSCRKAVKSGKKKKKKAKRDKIPLPRWERLGEGEIKAFSKCPLTLFLSRGGERRL